MTPRFKDRLYNANKLALRSPCNRLLLMPTWFVLSPQNVSKFVNTARRNKPLPSGLGANLKSYNKQELLESHRTMREIIKEEDNGVWEWFILNQTGPNNLRKKIGRIVSNPPWVRFNKIDVRERKNEIKDMANELDIWTGGETATSFDEAALFVDRCTSLYFSKKEKRVSGWVLPHGSIMGDAWANFRKKFDGKISGIWELGRLPFSNTPTCVTFFGIKQSSKILKKKSRLKLNSDDSWKVAKSKTLWEDPNVFPISISQWVDQKDNPIARNGATITPHCLTWIDSMRKSNNNVKFITHKSMHSPWSDIGVLDGTVPSRWVANCLYADDIVPYLLYKTTKCVIPLKNDKWDEKRNKNKFWRDVTDYYANNHGSGKNTPKTLEKQLNFSNKLFKQFERKGAYIVYNVSGDILYAARLTDVTNIVGAKLSHVKCSSKNEAYFIISILNANCMLAAFKWTQQSDRDFSTHFWKKIPIPRFDSKDAIHQKLAVLGKRAEKLARKECKSNSSLKTTKLRNHIQEKLKETGIADEVDKCCSELFPDYILPNITSS